MPAKVGYKSPPVHTRFNKGRSGNPKGRPPRKTTDLITTLIHAALHEPVSYSENGRPKIGPKKELLIKRLLHEAQKGDHLAAGLLVDAHSQGPSKASDGRVRIVVDGWLPDHPGQTGAEKTGKYRAQQQGTAKADPPAAVERSVSRDDGDDHE